MKINRIKSLVMAWAAVGIVLLSVSPARSDLIYSTFGPSQSFSSMQFAVGTFSGTTYLQAVSFTPSFDATLDSIDFAAQYRGNPEADHRLFVYLTSDSSGFPGSPLETFTFSSIESNPAAIYTAVSVNHGLLAGNTQYWIVLESAEGELFGWNADDVAGSVANKPGSGSWTVNATANLPAFDVNGSPFPPSTPVPEPATLLLLGSGLMGLLRCGRRRFQK